jgi:uncharacterized protein (DUF983 family)
MTRPSLTSLLTRALKLRCPRCGARGILASWTRLKARCPQCDLAFDRGETEDYWLGAFAINWVVGEGIALAVALVVLLTTWPDSRPALWTGIALAVMVPVALFPFSRTVWLAVDLAARATEPGDDREKT